MNDLEQRVAELEKRINWAVSQLNSLANEQIHRRNGAPFAEIDSEDLEEVIDVLLGKEKT